MYKNRALLLDRDGVINKDTDHVGSIARFEFLDGLFPFLRAVQDRGYKLAVLTNQSGVARQKFSQSDYDAVTRHMTEELRRQSIDLELTLACFEHPEGTVPELARESYWRKPNPGMVLEAVRKLNLDAGRSAFVGDKMRDLEAAQKGGINQRFLLMCSSEDRSTEVMRVSSFEEIERMLGA